MIDIVMLSNVDWHISDKTKQSLLKYARKDRLILQIEPDFIHMPDCRVPVLDKRKMEIIKTKATSDSIYILDDDDWLLKPLQPVKAGFDGAIYAAQYGKEILKGVDCQRMGTAFGYIRCVFNRKWLLKAVEKAERHDINACFDVFLFYELALRGRYEERYEVIAGIDKSPRTMYVSKFRKTYHNELNKIKGLYEELP